jgi:hypothetical protein
MSEDPLDQPATKRDLQEAVRELRIFILDRENALIWKLLTLVLIIAAGQWVAVLILVQHWKP